MNRRGFTLVELLATLVVLAIVVGLVMATTGGIFKNAKDKTEDVFVGTLENALDIYLDSDARSLNFDTVVCEIDKSHKSGVKIYKSSDTVTFSDVINSSYSPLSTSDMHNPANKDSHNENEKYNCDISASVYVYRDSDYVYYYKVDRSALECLNKEGIITNLPSGCEG